MEQGSGLIWETAGRMGTWE